MNNAIGWHQDDRNPTVSHYWDGTGWTGELRWDGDDWVAAPAAAGASATPEVTAEHTAAPPAPAATPPVLATFPPPPAAGSSAATPAGPTDPTERTSAPVAGALAGVAMTGTSATLLAGSALATIGIFLPWEKVSSAYGSQVQTPSSRAGAVLLLLALVGGVAALGWSSRWNVLSWGRLAGLAVVTAMMAFFVVAKFHVIAGDMDAAQTASAPAASTGFYAPELADLAKVSVQPGLGLYLWTAGVFVIGIAITRAFIARCQEATA